MNRISSVVAVSLTVSALSLTTQPAFPQEASRADFDAFCEMISGRWIGDVTLTADFAGIGERGQELTAYGEFQTREDGNALVAKLYGGSGSGTWTFAYDALAKRIRTLWITSGGDMDQAIIYRQGAAWIERGEGSTAKGQKVEFNNKLTISDQGNTHTWTGQGTTNGQANDPRHDVWRRVSGGNEEAAASQQLREFGELVVGRWVCDITYINDWPEQEVGRGGKVTGYIQYQWINDKQAISWTTYDGNGTGRGIIVWDALRNSLVESACWSNGIAGRSTIRKIEPSQWLMSVHEACDASGKALGGGAVLTFSGAGNEIRWSGQLTENGQPLDPLQDVYHKVSSN